MELWDAYDAQGHLTGETLVRGGEIPDGLYHAVAEVLVRHRDGSFLLTQRDFSKPSYPGQFETSMGGSVLQGETVLEGARRELREETGIEAGELRPLYERVRGDHALHYGYLCEYGGGKDAITLQEGETIGYRWMTKDELLAFLESDEVIDEMRLRLRDYWEALRNE